MRNIFRVFLAIFTIGLIAAGCVSASLASAENIGAKWEKFRSLEAVPYVPMGSPKIDQIGSGFSRLVDAYIKHVVKPMIEVDKEGYTGIVAQFMEDVSAAKKSGKTENDVLQAWVERYGEENVAKLGDAFKFVRQQQEGKAKFVEVAIKMLPVTIRMAQRMPEAIDEVKAGAKDPFQAAKLVGAAAQVGQRIDALLWCLNFVKTLSEDQAAETAALQEYVDSFQSKVN